MNTIKRLAPYLCLIVALGFRPPVSPSQTPRQDPQQELLHKIVAAAIEQTHHTVRYDGSYVRIPYPGGDVPQDTGVCTDVLIRPFAPRGSICRRKFTKTSWRIFRSTRIRRAGTLRSQTQISIITASQI
jgi:uncharacterized protein YijF (DUF1287 family)